MLPRTILSLLVCPFTRQNLYLLDDEKARPLLASLARGELRYVDGTLLVAEDGKVEFLITENAHHLYSIIDGVPVLLESKQIDLQTVKV